MKDVIIALCAFFLLAISPAPCLALSHHTRREELIFTPEQLQIVDENSLDNLIDKLIWHNTIVLNESELILDFAKQIKDSGLPFDAVETRVIKYMKRGELPFFALEQALEREHEKIWRLNKLATLAQKTDTFTQKINGLELNPIHRTKILEAYALCIDAFRNSEERLRWLKPRFCDPIAGYDEPRHHLRSHEKDHIPTSKSSIQMTAYNTLIAESAHVAASQHLNDFEKIKMAKCISEHALRFFSAYSKPLKAIKRSYQYHQAPEKAFFAKNGVCGNFSAIAYNIANAIGLEGRVFTARKRHDVHTYLEFQIDGEWFHSHPFNSTTRTCDVVRFQAGSTD